jgi:hypothetical protein
MVAAFPSNHLQQAHIYEECTKRRIQRAVELEELQRKIPDDIAEYNVALDLLRSHCVVGALISDDSAITAGSGCLTSPHSEPCAADRSPPDKGWGEEEALATSKGLLTTATP